MSVAEIFRPVQCILKILGVIVYKIEGNIKKKNPFDLIQICYSTAVLASLLILQIYELTRKCRVYDQVLILKTVAFALAMQVTMQISFYAISNFNSILLYRFINSKILTEITKFNLISKKQIRTFRGIIVAVLCVHIFFLTPMYVTSFVYYPVDVYSLLFVMSAYLLELPNSIREVEFTAFMIILQQNVRNINRKLQYINEEMNRFTTNTFKNLKKTNLQEKCSMTYVKLVGVLHERVVVAIEEVNSVFHLQLLVGVAHSFVFISTNVFFITCTVLFADTVLKKARWNLPQILWNIYYAFKLTWFLSSCKATADEVRE
ncbi:hypothetical protein L9F63_016400, partial [Diploptera punctata]